MSSDNYFNNNIILNHNGYVLPKDLGPGGIYLRKSREDVEAEARGEGDVLERHRQMLFALAKNLHLNIIDVYEEVESGEYIANRPEIQRHLRDIMNGRIKWTLVIDLDRLGRGDQFDQGYIQRIYKESGALIITLYKVYDVNNEHDEESLEFEGFMSRRELKRITRRMQRGRVASAEEGNYIGTIPPYGYTKIKKGYRHLTLEYDPEQSDIVKEIYRLYVDETYGCPTIKNMLNERKIPSYTGKLWSTSAVINVLKNPVYAGYITWKKTKTEYYIDDTGKKRKKVTRLPREKWILKKGKHPEIVSEELYFRALDKLKSKAVPCPSKRKIANPMAGIISCAKCGGPMVNRPYARQKAHLICFNACGNKSTRLEFVEQATLDALKQWLDQYKLDIQKYAIEKKSKKTVPIQISILKKRHTELDELHTQKNKLHDLLERGIYDSDVFLERSNILADKIKETKTVINQLEDELAIQQNIESAKKEIIPQVESVLSAYQDAETPADKNNLLRTVIDKIEYNKEQDWVGNHFEISLKPRILKM